jgi:hypothetical protein
MEKIIQPLSSPEDIKAQAAQSTIPRLPTTPTNMGNAALPGIVEQGNSRLAPQPAIVQDPAVAQSATPQVPPTTQFLTDSSLQETKQPIQVGIYLIVGSQFIGVVLSFFRAGNNNIVFTLMQIADLLLGVGLLLRLEFVRKIMVALAVVLIILSGLDAFGLLMVQNRLNQDTVNYHRAVNRINQKTITQQQRDELTTLSAKMQAAQKKVGHAMVIAEINTGLEICIAAGTIAYLTRPKVRAVFRVLEQ